MDWHTRYLQQARWTKNLRQYLFRLAGVSQAGRILDVGCGTGVLEAETPEYQRPGWIGLDIRHNSLSQARRHAPECRFVEGNALALPFSKSSFDIVLCHFFLFWASDPRQALTEMKRVTRPGGSVLVLAEPDYGGRLDYPTELEQLGCWQAESLRNQGADPFIGRRLSALCQQAGLQVIESGVLGGQWSSKSSQDELMAEWEILRFDLGNIPGIDAEEIDKLFEVDQAAARQGGRVLFVPTFYCWAKV